MKAIIQRVKYANVMADDKCVGEIEKGFLVLLGVKVGDTKEDAEYIVKKICNMRIFEDDNGKMNVNIKDVNGKILVVSQFTLLADCSNGNRPSFIEAAEPKVANELYEYVKHLIKENLGSVESGIFGANMKVSLLNDGPVTIDLESKK